MSTAVANLLVTSVLNELSETELETIKTVFKVLDTAYLLNFFRL